MKRLIFAFLLSCLTSFAQSITIPAQTITTPVTINGFTAKITITVPAQTVALPASGGTALPSGITWANNVLTVAGSVQATSVSLTGGPALPTCTSGLFLWQLVSGTLTPACYVAPTLTVPAITVSQAASPINTFTLNP